MTLRRHARNATKMAGFVAFGFIGVTLFALGAFWPLLLWHTFNAPLSVAVAILLVWWASLL